MPAVYSKYSEGNSDFDSKKGKCHSNHVEKQLRNSSSAGWGQTYNSSETTGSGIGAIHAEIHFRSQQRWWEIEESVGLGCTWSMASISGEDPFLVAPEYWEDGSPPDCANYLLIIVDKLKVRFEWDVIPFTVDIVA